MVNGGKMFTEGQQILIPDFSSLDGTWGVQPATIRIGAGENRFHIEYESGLTLWGTDEKCVGEMMDKADDIQRRKA
jgi:hypothetical protein